MTVECPTPNHEDEVVLLGHGAAADSAPSCSTR